jgi:hypothetical protein
MQPTSVFFHPPCTAVRCFDAPLAGVAYASWAANCGTTVGSTCTATALSLVRQPLLPVHGGLAKIPLTGSSQLLAAVLKRSPLMQPVQTQTAMQQDNQPSSVVLALLQSALLQAAALQERTVPKPSQSVVMQSTLQMPWTAGCPAGTTANPEGLINGLVVGSAAAQSICCSSGVSVRCVAGVCSGMNGTCSSSTSTACVNTRLQPAVLQSGSVGCLRYVTLPATGSMLAGLLLWAQPYVTFRRSVRC